MVLLLDQVLAVQAKNHAVGIASKGPMLDNTELISFILCMQ